MEYFTNQYKNQNIKTFVHTGLAVLVSSNVLSNDEQLMGERMYPGFFRGDIWRNEGDVGEKRAISMLRMGKRMVYRPEGAYEDYYLSPTEADKRAVGHLRLGKKRSVARM